MQTNSGRMAPPGPPGERPTARPEGLQSDTAASGDRVLRGIGFMLLAVSFFPCLNASVKFLSGDYPTIQILWARYAGHLIYMLILFAPRHGWAIFVSRRPGIQLSRSLLLLASTAFYYTALRYVSQPTAAAINFTSPFMVALLAIPILGERVGPRRWIAIAVGLLGALVIIRPGGGAIHPAAFLVLGTAFTYGLYQVLTRKIAAQDKNATTIVYTAFVGFAVMSVLLPFDYAVPTRPVDWMVFFAPGFFGALGHYFLIRSYECAPAAVISPLNYGQLVGSVILGYLIFGDFPDLWTWVGSAIIIAGGLYLIRGEARTTRDA
jgi:drug/metabolite transporter (DMT)-like permease